MSGFETAAACISERAAGAGPPTGKSDAACKKNLSALSHTEVRERTVLAFSAANGVMPAQLGGRARNAPTVDDSSDAFRLSCLHGAVQNHSMELTSERLAKNEALFRDVNERVAEIDQRFPAPPGDAGSLTEFLCECSAEDCLDRISLTREEYEAVRAHPTRFVIKPGHEVTECEGIVELNDRFAVAEKRPGTERVALESDPRRPAAESDDREERATWNQAPSSRSPTSRSRFDR